MSRLLLPALALVLFTACGLSDDSREEEKKHTYIRFTDPAFGDFCLEKFDLNKDGRISVYEAQRVLDMDCSGRGIASLSDLSYFTRVRRLDCADNSLAGLDLRPQRELERLDCARNHIASLDLEGLRSLTRVDCSDNALGRLGVGSNVSLSTLLCGDNRLSTLDVSRCALTMAEVAARNNPQLTAVYVRAGQTITVYAVDVPPTVAER